MVKTSVLNMQKVKALCFLFFAVSFSCTSSGKEEKPQKDQQPENGAWFITIRGKVASPSADGQILIQELTERSGGWQDTIQLKADKTFAKKIKLSEPGYYRINFYNRQRVDLILHKNDLEINVDGSSPQGFYEVKGSSDIELIKKIQGMLDAANNSPVIEKLNQEFTLAAQNKDEKKMLQLQQQYQQHISKEHDKVAALLEQNSPSMAAINLLQNNTLDHDKYLNTFVRIADRIKKEWPTYTHGKSFVSYVDKLKATAIGQPAPEIALPDPDGKVISLSSMKGKYVLVDFWAKWCGPCRQENPNVVRAYNKYKDKGFTVFGVSLDRRKEDWLQAIKEDGLTWTHVSDLKYWQSEAAKTYNITGIPFSLLLDPNGVIIDKNLRGPALDKRLGEIFNKK